MAVVAVTKRGLAALTSAALVLPGMHPKTHAAGLSGVEANFDFAYYDEGGDRMKVEIYQLNTVIPVTDQLEIRVNGVRDVISGASPIYNRPVITQPPATAARSQPVATTRAIPLADHSTRKITTRSNPAALQVRSGASGTPEPTPPTPTPTPTPTPPTPVPEPPTPTPPQPQPPTDGGTAPNPPANPGPGPSPNPAPVPTQNPGSAVTQPPPANDTPTNQSLNPNDVQVKQVISQPVISDERYALDIQMNYAMKDFLVGIGGGFSTERDYSSNFGNLSVQYEFNNNLTTVSTGFNYSADKVEPVGRNFKKDRNSQQLLLGASHVFTKNLVFQSTLTYNRQSGYLNDPYKRVFFVDGGILDENRPGRRNMWSILNRFTHFIPFADASVHLDYRFFSDNWGINSHTFELSWFQPLGDGWAVRPRVRYYSQTQADFYQPFFIDTAGATNFSSDYRLAEFGAISGGISLSKIFYGRLKLQAGVEYYSRQADLSLSSDADDSFADYDFTLVNASISYRF